MKYVLLLLVLFTLACGSSEEAPLSSPPPSGILPAEKFALVMADVQLAEAVVNQKMIREDEPLVMGAVYYTQVFEKHGISKEDFQKSHAYWASRPQDMLAIYDLVITELTKMEGARAGDATEDQ
jgi:hypothetical protein